MALQAVSVNQDTRGFFRLLKDLFNLRADTDQVGTIESIRSNVEFRSANAWTLVFAIVIASVGLNVNSTAVIIGAMLISPLMGPIVGAGFALGTYDFVLLKKCAKNLAAAVMISITASATYFLLSPLSEVQSELLARTRPSFFDVLIAFFGGAAGIVAISRKERGTAIPGVAIATALMPPLCTAGFGLVSRNWSYFFGAMYLFVINGVFITISTLLVVRYLKFYEAQSVNSRQQKYTDRWIAYVGAAVLIPSFFMAWYLQQESSFKSQAEKFIRHELQSENLFVVDRDISYSMKDPKLKVSVLGEPMGKEQLEALKSKAKNYSISPSAVEIRQSSISENIEKKITDKLSAAEVQANQMQLQLKRYELELSALRANAELSKRAAAELSSFLPGKVSNVHLINNDLTENDLSSGESARRMHVLIEWRSVPSKVERKRANDFLARRLDVKESQIRDVRDF